MNTFSKIFISALFLSLLTSCGADKLNPKTLSQQNSLSAECVFTSEGPLVCGMDGKEYINRAQAECITTVKHVGHCVCDSSLIVCGSDGLDHTECEAINNPNYTIVKLSPCASTTL